MDAAVALIRIAGPSDDRIGALADLLRLKKDPEDDAATYAAMNSASWAVRRTGRPAAPAALKYPDVRDAAADALGPVGADPDAAVPALLALLKDEPDAGGVLPLAGALGHIGPAAASAIPALRETLRERGGAVGGWRPRRSAKSAAGRRGRAGRGAGEQGRRRFARRRSSGWAIWAAPRSAVEALKKAEKDDPQVEPQGRRRGAEEDHGDAPLCKPRTRASPHRQARASRIPCSALRADRERLLNEATTSPRPPPCRGRPARSLSDAPAAAYTAFIQRPMPVPCWL